MEFYVVLCTFRHVYSGAIVNKDYSKLVDDKTAEATKIKSRAAGPLEIVRV